MKERHLIERQALQLMAKGQWKEAIRLYEGLTQQYEDPNLHNLLGDLYLRVGRIREALSCYEDALKGFMADQLFSAAVAVAHKILRRDPERVFPYLQIATVYAQQGYVQDAISTLQRCLTLPLTPHEKRKILSILKILLNHASPVHRPSLKEIYLKLGVEDEDVMMALGLQPMVETAPEPVSPPSDQSEVAPESPDVWNFFYLLIEIESALSQGVEPPPPSMAMARALYDLNLYHATILELQNLLTVHPQHLEATLLLGKAFFHIDDLELALRAFRQGYEATEGERKLEFLYWMGRTHEQKGETETALHIYQEILYQDLDFLDVKQRIERLTPGGSRLRRERLRHGYAS